MTLQGFFPLLFNLFTPYNFVALFDCRNMFIDDADLFSPLRFGKVYLSLGQLREGLVFPLMNKNQIYVQQNPTDCYCIGRNTKKNAMETQNVQLQMKEKIIILHIYCAVIGDKNAKK